jgi:hypothetical protein
VVDSADNCRTTANAGQADADGDAIGNACETICNDGLDNDGDGASDYPADPGCGSRSANTERAQCNDGLDNDGDGRIDGPLDVGCRAPADATERATCSDGLDNNDNGQLDFDGGLWATGAAHGPAEPACRGAPWASNEALNVSCGLGPEVALLAFGLQALVRWRRRD